MVGVDRIVMENLGADDGVMIDAAEAFYVPSVMRFFGHD